MKRREVVKNISFIAGAMAITNRALAEPSTTEIGSESDIKHSVCRWCYNDIDIEVLCEAAQQMGIKSVEIVGPEVWPTLRKYNLDCGMATDSFANISKGFNDPSLHAHLQPNYKGLIKAAADNGVPNVIVFSGNRNGMKDSVGLENCAIGLEPLVKYAEELGVNVVMELLNSKVNHKDYMCDLTPWGVELVEKIGSPRFKLLYDIYHMQIMEGDVIATIRDNHQYFAHYHTGGVPGRHEIDESQELYYPAIVKAIRDTGFQGYLAQEFIPARKDKLASLKQGVEICTLS